MPKATKKAVAKRPAKKAAAAVVAVPDPNALTITESLLIDHYFGAARLNLAKAGRLTGISERSAYRLWIKASVKHHVEREMAEIRESTAMTKAEMSFRLASIARFEDSMVLAQDGSLLPSAMWPPEAHAAVKSIEVNEIRVGDGEMRVLVKKITTHCPLKAMEMLGKMGGMFNEHERQGGEAAGTAVLAGLAELIGKVQDAGGGVAGLIRKRG
jgi:hypothetical protein